METFVNEMVTNLLSTTTLELSTIEKLKIPQNLVQYKIVKPPYDGDEEKLNCMLLALKASYDALSNEEQKQKEEKIHFFINQFFIQRFNKPHHGLLSHQELILKIRSFIGDL